MLNRVIEEMLVVRSTADTINVDGQLQFVEVNTCTVVGDLRFAVFEDRIRYKIGELDAFTFYFEDYEEYKDVQASRIVDEFLEFVDEIKKSRVVIICGESTTGLARISIGTEISLEAVNEALEEDVGFRLDGNSRYNFYTWSGKIEMNRPGFTGGSNS